MEFDAYESDEQAGEKKIPSPESILETLMVGCFVMGGSERLAEIQTEFKCEFGEIEDWILLNTRFQDQENDQDTSLGREKDNMDI